MTHEQKKHPCTDCRFCQWCGDDRCSLCRSEKPPAKLSMAEQIALFTSLNSDNGTGEDEGEETW